LLEVERQDSLINAVRVEAAGAVHQVRCSVVIDGSDRGELLPLASAAYRLGWEPQEQWGEPSAPALARLDGEAFFQQQPVQSPTWVVMGQLQSDRLAPEPSRGIDPAAPTPLAPPFERSCEAFGLERTITYGRLPGGLVMLNWPLHGNDWDHGLERAFSADAQQQKALSADMQAHSLRFAEALQQAIGGWLQLGEAFPSTAGSPAPWLAAMPYWREGRRMLGRHTVIEQELLPVGSGESVGPMPLDGAGALQSIAVGNYANDHHYPGPDWPLAPKSIRWGGRWSGTPFCIPYGALVSAEIDNLLAADKAFSTSHMANGATRLQPLILNVGQAAGAAAALAVRSGVPPAELPVRVLQECLINDERAPSAVAPLWDLPWHHPQWRERQLAALNAPATIHQSTLVSPDTSSIPQEPHERVFSGRLTTDGNGGFQLSMATGEVWPVITLEPSLHSWLAQLDQNREVELIGCANPWGPWLRVSRLAG
jgi:hypothetical protein